MPHAELTYSGDLDIDAGGIMRDVEALILRHDAGAGVTKGRAYAAATFNHTHCKLVVALLAKPHRGAAFTAALQSDIFDLVAEKLPRPCWLSVDITYSGTGYRTELLE